MCRLRMKSHSIRYTSKRRYKWYNAVYNIKVTLNVNWCHTHDSNRWLKLQRTMDFPDRVHYLELWWTFSFLIVYFSINWRVFLPNYCYRKEWPWNLQVETTVTTGLLWNSCRYKSGWRSETERRLSCVPDVNLRGATWYTTLPTTTCTKLVFSEGSLGTDRRASLAYSLFKPGPQRWQPMCLSRSFTSEHIKKVHWVVATEVCLYHSLD